MMKSDNELIDSAIESLFHKISKVDIPTIAISEYNKRYLKEYQKNFYFFMPLYKQLIQKILNKLSKPISESNFIDYGGGCGILSYLAVELGFKKVIYNDIYEVSVKDTKVIAELINCPIDYFISGDVKDVVDGINAASLQVDVISSFDVLEHIYDLENWFNEINKLSKPFIICFMTTANTTNPIINRRLKKIHYQAEYVGSKRTTDWKERDAALPFLEIRKKMISKQQPKINDQELILLAKNTRGLFGADIIESVEKQIRTKEYKQELSHPTNTCDPLTGNWAENSINLKFLKTKIQNKNTTVQYTNGYYSYSNNKFLNLPKYALNFFIKLFGKQSLFLSPNYTLEVVYKK